MTRKPKRARVSGVADATSTSDERHQTFTAWAEDKGVQIHNVAARKLSGRGLGLVVTAPIEEGSRILFVPESTIFKPSFTFLRQSRLEQASSQAKLVVSSLSHFAATDSPGAVWRETWPSEDDFRSSTPLYWLDECVKLLPGSAEAQLRRQRTDYQRDWLMCKATVSKLGMSEEQFRYHWMIVNSRSFHWANSRGASGYMVMCPFIDYMNHGPTGTGCTVVQRSDGYEVIAQKSYKRGEEILASYGAHVNEKLLVHYGFIIAYDASSPSTDDEVRIDNQVLGMLEEEIRQQLGDLGFLGPFALVPTRTEGGATCGWEPCFKTQVAVRATYLTCNEWEYFAEHGEDLGGDNSHSVASKLVPGLERFEQEISTRRGKKPKAEAPYQAALELIDRRWAQIASVVRWYINSVKTG